ncbi:DUF547 domain-containing protein [Emticicia oligotrophica]|uniref:DUF547 domain-containing protein n=1 Tax=Emticicia oligotrophica TaxID=312279 RepID=UPI00273B6921|nr:DUF547 domain-containing protein [Emticicia oligotrophica]
MKNKLSINLTELSGKLLLHVKKHEDTTITQTLLENITVERLTDELNTDDVKKCFWINIYNAYYQLLALKYNQTRGDIFKRKEIKIARNQFSLDDIEHGILRKYRWKFSLGYLPNIFVSVLIKKLTVNVVDYRIHFALNCGAISCPPIAFYKIEQINTQLENAMFSFIEAETEIDETKKTIQTSKLMLWFKGDFGGKRGIKQMLEYVFEKELNGYKINYKAYNWDKSLANFS